MLILSNGDAASLLSMAECMDCLEQAYQALREGRAINGPRVDSLMPVDGAMDGRVYSFKQMTGGIQGQIQAIRINSDIIHWPTIAGNPRRVKIPAAAQHWVGLIYLFDTTSGMPVAILPDGVLQHLRVGATSGLAAKYLVCSPVHKVALLGTGWQAETQCEAIVEAVRPQRVCVYSPNGEHRQNFLERMTPRLPQGVRLDIVSAVEEAVHAADVVMAATNSMTPVLHTEWIKPGMHFSTIKAQEVDLSFIEKTRTFLHTRRQVKASVIQTGNIPPWERADGWWKRPEVTSLPDLTDLVGQDVPGRLDDHEVTLFVNNVGMGLQFAAVGARLLEKALASGCGHELPDEWFLESVHP